MNIEHPSQFKQGYRILMLILRSKEGGKVNKPDRVAKKVISRNETEFEEKFQKLLSIKKEGERIYSTIDERDIEKAIRTFKFRQLENDYADSNSHYDFYTDIWNRWISSLQAVTSKKGTLFLVDIDSDEENGQNVGAEERIRKEISDNKLEIIHEYNTKNGKHIILKPFNPAIVSFQVQKNAMMLLSY